MNYKRLLIIAAVSVLLLSTSIYSQDALTIDQSIEIALENSPQIRRSILNLERSKESLNAQNASLLSQFNLSVTPFEYTKDRQFNDFFSTWNTSETKRSYGTFSINQPIIWTDGVVSFINRFSWQDSYSEFQNEQSSTFSNNLYLSYSQPLFTYNRTRLQLDELELDLENAALGYAIQKLAITRNVSEAFYNVYQQTMRVQIANDEYESQKQNYDLTQKKVDADILSKDELYQAELNMLNSQMSYQNEKVTLQNQLDNFKQLIGMPIENEISIIADVSYNPLQVDLEKAITSGINSRMELRQREIDIENSQFDLIKTSATNEFYGNISLSAGLIGTDEAVGNIYDKPTNNQQFTLSFDIPIFDWGERESRIKASEKNIDVANLSLEDEKIGIIVSLRSVYRNLENLETQIEISQISERNAQLSYEINLERYSNGDLTSYDLQQFQSQLSEAKLNRINALINYRLELLNLKIQSLYDFEKDQPVMPDIKYEKN
ncbi:MAG: TolC family protein [Melioribacteraceae bacterium]|nr:TolC family protein [Melioribacteraceae bacterium]MCF8354467.1 TolC family protein [Melioribacteraceae bacterium]MCF8394077.1 TolC family protein [Melioribacteraceae bacterium]MCF8419870.1 TolC family protein [Melioribacteraceae bacterium]